MGFPWDMTVPKHTPAPWIANHRGSTIIHTEGGRVIAMTNMKTGITEDGHLHMSLPNDLTEEEVEANGKVLAAAPDLLRLAQEIVERDPVIERLQDMGHVTASAYTCVFCACGDFATAKINHTDNCWWIRTRKVLKRLQ